MNRSSVSPIDLGATRTHSPAEEEDGLAHDAVKDVGEEEDESINVDDDARTDKRLNWTVEEGKRLASAWLRNSKDSVDGNGKKVERYWEDVTTEYNKTTETSHKRNRNQLKIRWDRSRKPLTDFHGVWVNADRVWQSGMSDDQLTDKALEMWAGQNSGKAFHLLHMWKVVRGQQKWSAYIARLKKEKEKSTKANSNLSAVVNLDLDGEKRPMGQKKAKKELKGNKKGNDALSDLNNKFDKFIEASNKNRVEREKMIEIQQSLADKKIKAAKISHEAAHEQTKCKMLETYTQLLLTPHDQLNADALAERNLALESMRLALFPNCLLGGTADAAVLLMARGERTSHPCCRTRGARERASLPSAPGGASHECLAANGRRPQICGRARRSLVFRGSGMLDPGTRGRARRSAVHKGSGASDPGSSVGRGGAWPSKGRERPTPGLLVERGGAWPLPSMSGRRQFRYLGWAWAFMIVALGDR
uniref:Uncharacterized protein n=1 Tax=Setaria viridis TaxID=4556 RepID=A0A4U6VUX3_SETVI|nr:hypothetical protein SEVIR_2G193400v2 [Setaria viridis]